jgi:predicted phage tail protein
MFNEQLTDIYLHGALGDEFGKHWRLNVHSPAEAVRALAALKPGFLPAIERLNAVVEGFVVEVGDRQIGEALLQFPSGAQRIEITPILLGADTKGILEIVIGVAIIAAAIYLGPVGWGGLGYLSATYALQIGLIGAAIALAGVSRMLMSTPSLASTDPSKNRTSYVFSGIVNVAGQGQAIPVFFGEMIIGSMVVSTGMEAVDIAAGGGHPPGGGGGGGQPPIGQQGPPFNPP